MHKLRIALTLIIFIAICGKPSELFGQDKQIDSLTSVISALPADSAKVESMLTLTQLYFGTDPEKAISIGYKAEKLGRKIHYLKGAAYALKYVGIAYYYQGNYIESLGAWQKSLAVFDSINDKVGMANIQSNIGAIYYNEGDYSSALDYYLKSLKTAEEIKDTLRIVTALTNIGAVYNDNPSTHDKALGYSLRALRLSEAIGEMDAVATTSVNIGEIYLFRKQNAQALKYFQKSLDAMQGTDGTVYTMVSIAKVYTNQGQYDKALQYLDDALIMADQLNAIPNKAHAIIAKAEIYRLQKKNNQAIKLFKEGATLARSIRALKDLERAYSGMNGIYREGKNFDSAYKYQQLLMNVTDSIYNVETDKLLSDQMFNFQMEKKQREIDLLKENQELVDQDLKKQKIIRNLVTAGFVSVIIFLVVAVFQNKRISREKERSENLLLNILPYEIAEELKEQGKSDARDFDQVTVIFTDFKEFTGLSQIMTAKELVEEINFYFMAFDKIVTKYKEKIKTIGDAYMAAGGLPVPNADSVKNVVMAAIEMQKVVIERQQNSDDELSQLFNMRIGIHTGPVVAGIVGVKKFQYDIWGDTVNTASRMESAGSIGKINVSGTTYDQLKDCPEFIFEHRGKVEAKGKGKLDMYFVELNPNFAGDTVS